MARYSNEQLFELARFVEQVSPDAVQEFARLFTERSLGLAAFSASAALLLLRALRPKDGAGPAEGARVKVRLKGRNDGGRQDVEPDPQVGPATAGNHLVRAPAVEVGHAGAAR
jgi:hypothetical protein